MAKKTIKNQAPFELFVSVPQLNDIEKFYSVYASPNVEDLVEAHSDEEVPLDDEEITVAVYQFMGFEKYKKSRYTRVDVKKTKSVI